MAVRVQPKEDVLEYDKRFPRTLEEAFGDRARLTLVVPDNRPHVTVTLSWVLRYCVVMLILLGLVGLALAVTGKYRDQEKESARSAGRAEGLRSSDARPQSR